MLIILAFPLYLKSQVTQHEGPIQNPMPVFPPDGYTAQPGEYIQFSWTPPIPIPPFQPQYQFALFELQDGQTVAQALRSNEPVFETYTTTNFCQYPEDLPPLKEGDCYTWTVTTFDPFGTCYCTQSSVPWTISIAISTVLEDVCLPPQLTVQKASAISLGMRVEEPELFKYPRAVPIQAEGYDWDKLKIECFGCAGYAMKEKAVRDLVHKYQWKLTGKGSLGDAFQMEKIQEKQKKVDSLRNAIAEMEARIEEIDTLLARIPKEKEDLEKKIEEADKEISKLDSALIRVTSKRDSLLTVKKTKTDDLKKFEQQEEDILDAIDKKQASIDSLQDVIDGKPTDEEIALMDMIDALEEQLESLQEELKQTEEEIIELTENFEQQSQELMDDLEAAAADYDNVKNQIEANNKQIAQLESQLFSNPNIKEYYQHRGDWTMKATAFIGAWLNAQGGTLTGKVNEVNAHAQSVLTTSDPTLRAQRLATFNTSMNTLMTSLSNGCSALAPPQNTNCLSALSVLTVTTDAFRAIMDTVAASNAVINPAILAQIETLRTTIKGQQAGLGSSEAQLEQASQAYEAAVENFKTQLEQKQDAKSNLDDEIEEITDSLISKEAKLQDKIKAREDTLANNMDKYLEDIKAWKEDLIVLGDSLGHVQDSIVRMIYDTMTCGTELREVEKEIKRLKEEKAVQQKIKADAEAALDALDAKKAALEAEKQALEEAIEAAKKKLEEEEKELKKQFTGTKEAIGEIVYYIPPPLEDDLMPMEEFDQLKKKVKEMEDSLNVALAEKVALQVELTKDIEGLANTLADYKKAADKLEQLKEDKTDAELEYSTSQVKKSLELNTEKAKAQADKTASEADVTELETELEAATGDSAKVKEELNAIAEKLTASDSLAEFYKLSDNAALTVVEKKYEILDSLEVWIVQKSIIDRYKIELEIKSLEDEKGRAQNDLTQAKALDDASGVLAAQSRIQQADRKIEAEKQKMTELEQEIAKLKEQQKKLVEELAPSEDEAQQKDADFREKLKDFNKNRQEFAEKNDEYKEILSKMTELKRKISEANGEVGEADEKLEELDDVDSLTNDDDDVKELKEALDEIVESIEEAEQDQKDAEDALEKAGEPKEKEKKAEDKIKTARENLKNAEKELSDFLHKYFDNPKFDPVTIQLMADDKVVDGYRISDDPMTITNTITYAGRVPQIPTISADASSPTEEAASGICDVQLDLKKNGEPEVTGVGNGREPRTIALVYQEGKILWDVWPVIRPEQDKLLAKDVVPVNAAISHDHDDMITQCSPGMFYTIGTTTTTTTTGTTGTTATTTGTPTYSGTTTTQTYSEGEGCPPSDDNGVATSTTGTTTAGHPTTQSRDAVPMTNGVYVAINDDDNAPTCMVLPASGDNLVDLGTFTYELSRPVSTASRYDHSWILWEPQKVDKPKKSEPRELKCKYVASEIFPDDEKKNKSLPEVYPGVLTEVKDSILGVPDTQIEVQGRVITGDHKGLEGEDVEFSVTLIKGKSEGYGFDGGATTVTKITGGDGYAKTDFDFGDGYAEFDIKVKWKRGSEVIEEDSTKAKSPLFIQMCRFAMTAPDFAWEKAKELYEKGEFNPSMVEDFPEYDEDEPEEYERIVHGVAGLWNYDRKYVNGEKVEFKVEGEGAEIDPETDSTELIGIARTVVDGVEKEKPATLIASAEEKYKPVCRPKEAKKTFKVGGIDKIRIGSESNPFIVLLDEEATEGEEINGTGKLSAEIPGVSNKLIAELLKVKLRVNKVQVKEGTDLAIEGSVSWVPESPIKATIMSFEIALDSFNVYAYKGARIGGTVKKDTVGPVKFGAAFDPTGNFLAEVSDLPAVGFKGFKLKAGMAISLDMHLKESPGKLKGSFQGIHITEAELELPERFKKKKDDDPSTIKAKDFSIGSGGISGSVSYNGTMFTLAYGGYEFSANKIELEFEESHIQGGSFEGEVKLGSPMEGDLQIAIEVNDAGFSVELGTENPVYIPRLAMTFKLMSDCGFEYDSEKSIGTLRLNAVMSSEKLGEMSISGFKYSSDGIIEAKSIKGPSNPITFGGGFSIKVDELSFLFAADEYSLGIEGEFGFKEILNIKGKLNIKPGPVIEVPALEVKFEKGPVNFEGSIEYKTDLFKGAFSLGIKMGSGVTKGITGTLVIGNQPINKEGKEKFSYWYVEIAYAGAPIPLGQSGIALMEVGGGVGYNYSPPIGNQEGAPVNETPFALKAIVGMGNVPAGQLLAGRMEMVLLPSQFSLYGRLWLLQQKENIYGEGQINLYWSPEAKLDGYVAMFVGLPDVEGEIFRFDGKINFSFPADDKGRYVWSEKLNGSVLNAINATGDIEVSQQQLKLDADLTYGTNKNVDLAVVSIVAVIDVKAHTGVLYTVATKTFTAGASFNGTWDVDLKTPLGDADLIAGACNLQLTLTATATYIEVKGSAHVSYDVWVYKGSHDLDVGYRMDI